MPANRTLSMSINDFIEYDAAQRGIANTMQANQAAEYYSTCLHNRIITRAKLQAPGRRLLILQLDSACLSWLDSYFQCQMRMIGDGTFWTGEYYDSRVKLELRIAKLETTIAGKQMPRHLAGKSHRGGVDSAWCYGATNISALKKNLLQTKYRADRGALADCIAQCSASCRRLDALGAVMTRYQRNDMARTVALIASSVTMDE